jgi:hypothetical protein
MCSAALDATDRDDVTPFGQEMTGSASTTFRNPVF